MNFKTSEDLQSNNSCKKLQFLPGKPDTAEWLLLCASGLKDILFSVVLCALDIPGPLTLKLDSLMSTSIFSSFSNLLFSARDWGKLTLFLPADVSLTVLLLYDGTEKDIDIKLVQPVWNPEQN